MTRHLPSAFVSLIIAFCVVNIATGNLRAVGQDAIDSFRCFNMYLDFNNASFEENYLMMGSVAEQIENLSGDSDVREFSAYIAGYSTSAESHKRIGRDALHWAETGAEWLQSSVSTRNKPFTGLQLAAYIYADRILPHRSSRLAREQMLKVYAVWLASGGGPDNANRSSAKLYQDYLALDREGRDNYILGQLQQTWVPE
jgi:hypothetical protein